MGWFLIVFAATLAALLVAGLVAFWLRAAVLNWAVDRTVVRLLKDPYAENLWDLVVGITRVPPHKLIELELRAELGNVLDRPLGTVERLADLSGIGFNPAQLIRQPLGPQTDIDLSTVIGPRAKHPLQLDMPILLGGMGYGVALSKPFVQALAQGATMAGTAYNAGSGPLLPEVADEADTLILQYAGGAWTRDEKVLSQADMIEIRYGHGGRTSVGRIFPAADLPAEARKMMEVKPNGEVIFEAPLPGASTPTKLRRLVPTLRSLIEGGPIGVKLAATHDIERELEAVLDAGVDVIAIDGAQGGTHGSPPILCDGFCIPTVHAIYRAVSFLERTGARQEVSLLVGGGLTSPLDMLRAIALGADAVYIGTAAMMAGTHGQLSKSIPFEPITQLCWATGSKVDSFDAKKGAQTVSNFLHSCAEEFKEAARSLGKKSIREINREDLIARDPQTAAMLQLPPSWRAPERK